LGGKAGLQAKTERIKETAIPDLERVHKDIGKHFNKGVVINWNEAPLAKGSYLCMKPGYYTRFGGAASEPELKGRLLFAGEHTSLEFSGFMNGAYESGITAAKAILISRNLPHSLPRTGPEERKPASSNQ
jgi:monoamine oxidase